LSEVPPNSFKLVPLTFDDNLMNEVSGSGGKRIKKEKKDLHSKSKGQNPPSQGGVKPPCGNLAC